MYKVIWIEDEAETQLRNFMHPVIMAGHALEVVTNVTDAVERLKHEGYDLIILDLILNAGSDKQWQWMDENYPAQDKNSYLGLQLLRALFDPDFKLATVDVPMIPPEKFAIFTVVEDQEVHVEIEHFGIDTIYLKTSSDLNTLLNIIHDKLD